VNHSIQYISECVLYRYCYCFVLSDEFPRIVVAVVAVAAAVLLPLRIMRHMRVISHQYCGIEIQLLLLVSPATNISVFGATVLGCEACQYIY